jgi:tRNA 2-thiocytidine biosynthesis protein TtcA
LTGNPCSAENRVPVPLLENHRFKKIKGAVGRAVAAFNLIEEGDRIMVAVSGGKDSLTLLHVLDALRKRAPIRYELMAATVDSGFPGFRTDLIREYLRETGIPFHIEPVDHYRIIEAKLRPGSSYCSFCARLKRGTLYGLARRFDCNKLALGHHLDDFVETLLLNQFYVGSLKAMAPRMLADNGLTTVIRPLVYVQEDEIAGLVAESGVPVVSCRCPVAGSGELKRERMKSLLKDLEREIPFIKRSLVTALGNVHPRHLLDPGLTRSDV